MLSADTCCSNERIDSTELRPPSEKESGVTLSIAIARLGRVEFSTSNKPIGPSLLLNLDCLERYSGRALKLASESKEEYSDPIVSPATGCTMLGAILFKISTRLITKNCHTRQEVEVQKFAQA